MKKLLALLLALVMVLSLAACGEEVDEGTSRRRRKASSNDEETTETVSETEEENKDTEEVTEEEVSEETEPAQEQEEETSTQWLSAYTVFEEGNATIIDDGGLTVTFGEPEEGDYWVELPVEMKNTTGGEITVMSVGEALNGKCDFLYLSGTVEAGKTIEETVDFYDISDPEDVTRVSMLIRATDENLDSKDYLIDYYPWGMDAYKNTMPKAKGKDVLVDEDGVFAAIEGYKEGRDAFSFDYLMINNSDETVHIGMDPVALNGFGIISYLSDYVLPGTYVQETATIDEFDYMAMLGLDEVTSLTLDVGVEDTQYKSLFKETVTVYPGGKKNDDVFVYTPDNSDLVLVDTDALKVTVVEVMEEDTSTILLFVVENKTDDFANFEATDIKINGKDMESGWIYCSAYDGRDTFDAFTIYGFQKQEMGITDVTSVEMLVTITNDNFKTVYEDTVAFTIY